MLRGLTEFLSKFVLLIMKTYKTASTSTKNQHNNNIHKHHNSTLNDCQHNFWWKTQHGMKKKCEELPFFYFPLGHLSIHKLSILIVSRLHPVLTFVEFQLKLFVVFNLNDNNWMTCHGISFVTSFYSLKIAKTLEIIS